MTLDTFDIDRAMDELAHQPGQGNSRSVAVESQQGSERGSNRDSASRRWPAGFISLFSTRRPFLTTRRSQRTAPESATEQGQMSSSSASEHPRDADGDIIMSNTVHHSLETSSEAPARVEYRNCLACADEVDSRDCIRTACRHDYCRKCTRRLFANAIREEGQYPPRCCYGPISITTAEKLLPKSMVKEFHAKTIEYSTKNRIYCHYPRCSAFIPPDDLTSGRCATCPKCLGETCAICKGEYHVEEKCPPQNEDDEKVRRLAKKKGWRKCPKSSHWVEHNGEGCSEMTCICGCVFCYKCGHTMDVCLCALENEEDQRPLRRR